MQLLFAITKFETNIKDKIKKEHHYNLSYSVKCPTKNCPESNNGETARTLIERGTEHSGKDIKSNLFRYSIEVNHPTVTLGYFTVLSCGYRNKKFKRKVSNSLADLCSRIMVPQSLNPLNASPTKWPNTLKQFVGKLPTNCLSVFDHFVKLALKGLTRRCLTNRTMSLGCIQITIKSLWWSFLDFSCCLFRKNLRLRCFSDFSIHLLSTFLCACIISIIIYLLRESFSQNG